MEIIKNRSARIFFVSGERGIIPPEKRVEVRTEQIPSWIGYRSDYLIEILSHCMVREPEKFEKIKQWASDFQLMNITAGRILTGFLESNFKDEELNINLNTSLSGLGSRQLLSVITQIFWSEPGDVILIEEPEISLHPENQVKLYHLFSKAVSEGKQIICTTHSSFFILALSKIIKDKLLKVDDIAVYHVEKDAEGTNIERLKLNEHGFIEGGIRTFMKVESDLYQDWLESRETISEEK